LVDQSGFAVVNVGDDRYITDRLHNFLLLIAV